jgi:class 3 adenylate cyclase
VLRGGLDAWLAAGFASQALPDPDAPTPIAWAVFAPEAPPAAAATPAPSPESLFLPRIAGQGFLEGRTLPLRQEMAVGFVDMVGSTRLVFERSAEEVLEVMQAFMQIVIDVGAYHCGDVHDFEGDGAFLYFEGAGEAVPAVFRLRSELVARRRSLPTLPLPRLSLDLGPVVLGVVGTRFRRTVALVGPAVHTAARILKLAPPGGIAVTDAIVAHARRENPELAREFAPREGAALHLDPELRSLRIHVAELREDR